MFVNHLGWLVVIPAVGAIVIPYFAVVFAEEAGREPGNTRGFLEYRPNLPTTRDPAGASRETNTETAIGPRGPAAATPVPVDVLARAESVLLRDRAPGLGDADADRLADQLGDLPLAVAQAAGFMAETGIPVGEYLDLLRTQAGRLLDQPAPGSSYPRSLAAATRLAADRLDRDDPAAAQLASLCAFLAPEPVPDDLFTSAPGQLPGELAARAADPLAWRQTLAHLARQSLARVDRRGLVMHRLTQAILRDRLTAEQAAATRACSEAVLAAADPGDPANPVTWPRWAQLMPHLLEANLADSPVLRWMARDACWYLLARGDTRTGHALVADLRQHWRNQLGDDHEHTLKAATFLAWALRVMGRYTEARELDADTLARSRRRSASYPETLGSANNLATDLRNLSEYQAARALDEDTLARCRRALGEDHPYTLEAAGNLAIDLRMLGEYQAARALEKDTLARCRRALGEDHPYTLGAASLVAADLRMLGEYQAARALDKDTLARCRRALGEDHPSTLEAAGDLAIDLRMLGEYQAARALDEDTLARCRRALGEDHAITLRSAANLAAAYVATGRAAEAIPLFERTLADRERMLGPDHPDTLASRNNLALAYEEAGRASEAILLFERTLADRERMLGRDHPDTSASRSNLAAAYQATGRDG